MKLLEEIMNRIERKQSKESLRKIINEAYNGGRINEMKKKSLDIDPNKWYGICYGRDLDKENGKYNE